MNRLRDRRQNRSKLRSWRGVKSGLPIAVAAWLAAAARAQDSYEIQVYGSETLPRGVNMIELHSNYTVEGNGNVVNGVVPSLHAFHETIEFTHGFSDWFETGFYTFTSIQPGAGWEWVGNHVRPRARVPERWGWPVGVSLSMEIGYQQPSFSQDTWTWEIRPIFDKQWGRFYAAVNPTFEKSLHGMNSAAGFEFAPSAKLSYELNRWLAAGVEYYCVLGPIGHFGDFGSQQQQIMPAFDLNVSPKWEINFGIGVGLNHRTDGLLLKLIVGRRF